MKCVESVGSIPLRVSDEDAEKVIKRMHGRYIPKRVWKMFHDHNQDPHLQKRRVSYITHEGRIATLT